MTDANPGIPEFAVLGHPNEGKSSLVSTLTEDDSVKISPIPGETTQCRIFPVTIDGREIVRFTDTPGFQAPLKTLDWFKKNGGQGPDALTSFIKENSSDPLFKDECELLSPLARGAGIIYVADGSRPMRSGDRAEMNILRLTGLPRMAVINSKSETPDFSQDWENEFKNHFNKVVYFNAHTASYRERINLLEALQSIQNQDNDTLIQVIDAFKEDWDRRNTLTAEIILNLINEALTHSVNGKITDPSLKHQEKKKLQNIWSVDIKAMEHRAHQNIRALFKHNIFNISMPDHSLLTNDLFDSETWKVLGLSRTELAASAATLGAAAAVTVDLALAGHSLGLFAAIGGAVGAGSALLGAKKIGKTKFLGKHLGGYVLKAGPHKNLQFMMILMDRALIFYSHIINWAHGKRLSEKNRELPVKQTGYVSNMEKSLLSDLMAYFSVINSRHPEKKERALKKAHGALKTILDRLSQEA